MILSLLFSTNILKAQEQIPDFGQIDKKELRIRECDFDKEADAIILFDIASSDYNNEHLITSRRIRFKILKEKGVDKANIEIPYFSKDKFEDILNLQAISITPLEKGGIIMKELDKKVVFTQKINERISVLKFTLPNVKVGTIIDYKYEKIAQNYGGLDDWYFQSDLPVVLSKYKLVVLPNAEFTYVVHKAKDIPIKVENDKGDGSITFEMNNIAGLRDEPFMDAYKDYLQHVEFQFSGYASRSDGDKIKYMTTWKESAQELLSAYYFGRQIEKNLPNSEAIIAKTNTFSTPFEKMKYIYEYVKNNFTWNNINTKFAEDGIKNIWENKKGTSGEINLILINLLKSADLQVSPMLVSERDHGAVNTDYPIIDQFNKVVAYIGIENRKFVLDATDVYTPINIIPFNLLNTTAFIIDKKKPELIKLTDLNTASDFINIYSSIDDDGMIDGYTTLRSYNYAKINKLKNYGKNEEKFQHNYFEKYYSEVKIDSFEISNTEADSLALEQQFKFAMPANVSEDYKLININLFSGLEKNPFTLDTRFTNVNFGCKYRTDIIETFEIASKLHPEEIPKNIQLLTPDKGISFIRTASLNDNVLVIQISLKINQTLYTTDDYSMLKEFYKKMYSVLDEQIVLSNK